MEQTLQPDEQMWIDVGKLIREHVPDKNGKTLPADLTSGSFEVRDLTDTGIGSLFEGKVIYDKTYGHAAYGCATCCDYQRPTLNYNPLNIPYKGTAQNGVTAYQLCADIYTDVSNYFLYGWYTGSTAIATVNYMGTHTGVGVGSTTSYTSGPIPTGQQRNCPAYRVYLSCSANVFCATPTNFAIKSESSLSDGSLLFTYTWSSSTGNQADLAACTVGESVFYPGYPTTPYIGPISMVQSTTNPTVINGKGSNAGSNDTNGPPSSYQQPYSSASFSATQRFWWSCPCYQNGNVQSFVPDITISRKVFKDTDGFWKYQITKSGYTNTVKLPGQ